MKQTKILDLKNIKFQAGATKILEGVTFSVLPGETVGIIGPNGSGKTTLFNCISGFNKISAGELHFKGKQINRKTPSQRAKLGIGRVFQNFGIFKEMTVAENMIVAIESKQKFWANLFPWSKSNRANRLIAQKQLSEVKLENHADRFASSLSGGQMRLLEIMRTLAFGAELFLLDEPTAGVAPKMKQDLADQIQKLKTAGKTVLVIEHDLNFIEAFCSRIIVLDNGRVVLDGPTEEVKKSELLQEIYLGKKLPSA